MAEEAEDCNRKCSLEIIMCLICLGAHAQARCLSATPAL